MPDPTQTEAQADPKLALKIALDEHAGRVYETTRALQVATHALAGAPPPVTTAWADLDERQRRTFIYDTADALSDVAAATLATGSRP